VTARKFMVPKGLAGSIGAKVGDTLGQSKGAGSSRKSLPDASQSRGPEGRALYLALRRSEGQGNGGPSCGECCPCGEATGDDRAVRTQPDDHLRTMAAPVTMSGWDSNEPAELARRPETPILSSESTFGSPALPVRGPAV
jgi:hypothetical protein